VIDTDELARQATAPGTPALAEIARRWPSAVRDGMLDRASLAAIVFSNAAEREKLNAIVHPVVRELARQRERASPQHRIVVHVVPLLFETGYAGAVDASVLVVAPEQQRVERTCARDGSTPADVRRRIAAQMPVEEARRRADYTIENDGDRTLLRERARQVYDRLLRAG
jgi:dephospho-CoA kinase